MFQPPGSSLGNASNWYQELTSGLGGFEKSHPGQYNKLVEGFLQSPYASQFQQGAGQAGQLAQNQALGQYGVGQQLTGLGLNQLAPYANTVMQTAMDPQNALYQRTLQQVMDQSGAQNAAAGVGTTPYGAGLQNDALRNFNIDWQNNLLGREISGLGAAGGALGQAGGLANLGQGLSASAPGQYLQGAGMPFGAAQNILGGQTGALQGQNQYNMGALGPQQQQIQDILGYLGWGNQANAVANNLFGQQLQQNNQNFNQWQTIGQDAGKLASLGFLNTPLTNPNMKWF